MISLELELRQTREILEVVKKDLSALKSEGFVPNSKKINESFECKKIKVKYDPDLHHPSVVAIIKQKIKALEGKIRKQDIKLVTTDCVSAKILPFILKEKKTPTIPKNIDDAKVWFELKSLRLEMEDQMEEARHRKMPQHLLADIYEDLKQEYWEQVSQALGLPEHLYN